MLAVPPARAKVVIDAASLTCRACILWPNSATVLARCTGGERALEGPERELRAKANKGLKGLLDARELGGVLLLLNLLFVGVSTLCSRQSSTATSSTSKPAGMVSWQQMVSRWQQESNLDPQISHDNEQVNVTTQRI